MNRLKLTIRRALGKQETGELAAAELEEADAQSDRITATFDARLRIALIEAGARKVRFASIQRNGFRCHFGILFFGKCHP